MLLYEILGVALLLKKIGLFQRRELREYTRCQRS